MNRRRETALPSYSKALKHKRHLLNTMLKPCSKVIDPAKHLYIVAIFCTRLFSITALLTSTIDRVILMYLLAHSIFLLTLLDYKYISIPARGSTACGRGGSAHRSSRSGSGTGRAVVGSGLYGLVCTPAIDSTRAFIERAGGVGYGHRERCIFHLYRLIGSDCGTGRCSSAFICIAAACCKERTTGSEDDYVFHNALVFIE